MKLSQVLRLLFWLSVVETEAGNTITDEYRAIYATDYENVILGDKAKKAAAAAQHHLYGTTSGKADDAIKADAD